MARKAKTRERIELVNGLLGIDDSYKAPAAIMSLLLGERRCERDDVFGAFLDAFGCDVSFDWFHEYFQEENAERIANKQDFTPDGLSRLASALTVDSDGVVYEPAAGTGGMVIAHWDRMRREHHPFDYRPSMNWFVCEDLSDRSVPFLLLNLAVRGINANVVHCNALTRQAKAVYLVENERNDMLAFSEVVELPRNEKCMEAFDVREWVDAWP